MRVVLSIHPSRHPSVPPSIEGKEWEEHDDSWRRQHVHTQSLASVISAKSIQTFGGEIVSMEQYTHQDPQPMNKAKMRNVLERNKLEEDHMLILLLLPLPQRRPPQQHVAVAALRQASHTTMSLNWRSSPSSSSVLLLLPLLLLVLSATATIAPCSSFADPVHICCSRLDPTYLNLQPCS